MRTLQSLAPRNLAGLTCLLRLDLNIENPAEAFRLDASIPTIRWLLRKKVRVIILSHRGRPTRPGKKESLRIVLPALRKKLRSPVTFLPTFDFAKIRSIVAADGGVALLENLRFHPGEQADDPSLARSLAGLGDFYVNDAFSVSHRKNSSITQLPFLLPSYAGFLLTREIENLSKVTRGAKKPLVVILGGEKVSDKLGMIKQFLGNAHKILIGGATANTFLKAQGKDIGASTYESAMLGTARRLLSFNHRKIVLPVDFIKADNRLLDIGPLSIKEFTAIIRRAKTIIWNGPMGYFEMPRFRRASTAIAEAVARSKAFSVVGGGETTQLIYKLGIRKGFGFMSTGGGAMLAFLGGEKLPGIVALEKSRKTL